jgi:spermidine/putrescine transport system permease protein
VARAFDARRLPGAGAVAVGVFVLLYLPIATLVVYSFNASSSVSTWEGLSLRWYRDAWANDAVQEAAGRSLLIATVATLVSTTVATGAALAVARSRFRGRTFVTVLVNQPLMVPEIVTAVALLIVFGFVRAATGWQGLGYLLLAHSAFCVPFAFLPIRARLDVMDPSLEAAAADLYAPPARAFLRVTLPLLAPGILAGAMLAFVVSLDDVIITEFVKSAGQDTLPTYLLGEMRRNLTPEVNAVSTALLVLTILLLAAFFLVTRQRSPS